MADVSFYTRVVPTCTTPAHRSRSDARAAARMDPDQVAAAGAHGKRHHLDDATASDGGGGESWPCALLRCGWRLSRKAAIVGAAATVAQVVAPPIALLSAAGLALSVPFAAYLAALAATDRLMSALLPSFPAEPVPVHLPGDARQEFVDASQNPGQEDALPPSPDLPTPLTVSFQESGQEPSVPNNTDKIEDGTTMEEEDAAAVQQSGQDSLESTKRDEISETPAAKFTKQDIVATTSVQVAELEAASGGERQAETAKTAYQVAVCSSVSAASPLIVTEGDETSQLNPATDFKHLYTEAQLREQLETVRTITGYTSPPSSTLAGELAGLYLFVGVEPQVSSTTDDASDLTEINAELRILKSIIGVD
ncbi:hypothetical protein GUJ93_ZPchr0011g27247 [Zizania palustris]|uniref:Uncharacterized protein n=1 Tax=Zizania palustris TaxID=103762 RepID=A0A8J5WEC8_ZIZPA|nr:hypothetical protein GUJ93_ZPchr0011g27247 [Zizania palustris]